MVLTRIVDNDQRSIAADDSSYDDCNTVYSIQSTDLRIVTFASRVRAKKTLALKSYTAAEMEHCWYDEEEMEAIRLMNHRTILQMKNKKLLKNVRFVGDDDEDDNDDHGYCYCERGLENQNANGDEPINKDVQLISRVTILREQQLQRQKGINEPEKIAAVYRALARPCERDALARARTDAQAAREIAQEVPDDATNKLGEMRVCVNRATLLLERRREIMRRKLAAESA